MLSEVKNRLESLGVAASDADNLLLDFCIQKAEATVKSTCNIPSVPDGLLPVAVDMACGEFLYAKKNAGMLEGVDLDPTVKQVQEGKSTVSFAVGEGNSTPEQRLDTLINNLINGRKNELVACRRINW